MTFTAHQKYIIPEWLASHQIPPVAKILYVIIEEHLSRGQDSLSSNYLSQVMNVSNTSIDNYIKKLKKAGLLETEFVKYGMPRRLTLFKKEME